MHHFVLAKSANSRQINSIIKYDKVANLANNMLGQEKNIVCFLYKPSEENRVGRSVGCIIIFGQKCVFFACFTLIGSWEGGKNFRVGISLNKNLLG